MRHRAAIALAVLAGFAFAAPAIAADPGRWVVTSAPRVPNDFRQGLAGDGAGNVFFSGPFNGIHKTRSLKQLAANDAAIPQDVADREQYNHIGDIAFDGAEGGRLLLPLESYRPLEQDQNPSKTGSIGVMSAATLHWSHYVKLDPAEIPKAQWIAVAPDGLFWTPTGKDLLAYRLADLSTANAAPAAAPIHSVRRLAGVVPDGHGGGAVLGGRIYMTGGSSGAVRIVSVDLATGAGRVEYEKSGSSEPEGVDFGGYLGGLLHAEFVQGLGGGELLNLLPKGTALRLRLARSRVHARRKAVVAATVTASTNGLRIPLAGVQVRIGRARARTNASGRARVRVKLTRGSYRAHAFFAGLTTATARLRAT
jgi:hypothetical protein